jgi:sarcosine oxidase subunit gamma
VTLYLLTKRISEEIIKKTMIAERSPLEGMNMGTADTVAIRELPGLHTIDLRVTPGSPAYAAINEALGMDLPEKPGQMLSRSVSGGGEAHALCLAPDWWLIVGLPEAENKLALLRLQNNYHFSIVDVSGQRTTIEVEGANVREVLAHLWDQDLRQKSFPVASVSQGLMAKAPVILCNIAPLRYRVMVRSSFALHLWKALIDAAEEWI